MESRPLFVIENALDSHPPPANSAIGFNYLNAVMILDCLCFVLEYH